MSRFFVVPFPERGRYAVVLGYESHRIGWRWVMGWEVTAKGAEGLATALNAQACAELLAAEREAEAGRQAAAGELLRALLPAERHCASRVDTRVSIGR